MLEKFFKPKWQHNKPEVRKQALLAMNELSPEHAGILTQVAKGDNDAAVRRVAVNRLHDLGIIREIMESDSDAEVRELARKRFFRMVAGLDADTLPLATRLEWVELERQADMLEAFARQGKDAEIRLTALTGITRESLLGDLAIGDADAQVRIAAAQRLTQQSTMTRVAKHSRSRDKKVYALVQGQLDRIKTEQEKPERLAHEGRALCTQLETLCKAKDMFSTVAQRDHVHNQWQQLQQEWSVQWGEFLPEVQQRYGKAREQYEKRYQDFLAVDGERRAQEQQYEGLRQCKRALCEALEAQVSTLQGAVTVTREMLAATRAQLEQHRQGWAREENLPRDEEAGFQGRFRQAVDQLQQELTDLERKHTVCRDLDVLVRDAERLQAGTKPIEEKALKDLRRRLQQFDALQDLVEKSRLQQVQQTLATLHERQLQQQRQQEQDVERFQMAVDAMEQALIQGNSGVAADQQRVLRQILRRLSHKGKQLLAETEWQHRYQDASKQLEEIRDWKRWSGTPHKEALLREVEQLAQEVAANAEIDIETLAAQVRAARDAWKRLGETDLDSSDQLWERFNNACNLAYGPCEEFFKQQGEERRLNQQRKEIICDSLEAFIGAPDFATADWGPIDQIVKTAQQEWRNIGTVNRKEGQVLGKRFKAALDTLRARLDQHLEQHGVQKEALLQKLRELVHQIDTEHLDAALLNQCLEQAKQLQVQWKKIGRARKEKNLWQDFRALNDQLFSRRSVVADAQKQELQHLLATREAIIADIGELASRPATEIPQLRPRYDQARKSWEQAGQLPKDQMKVLVGRYRDVCRDFERAQQRAIVATKLQHLDYVEQKSALCCQLERVLAQAHSGAPLAADLTARLEAVQRAWQDVPTGNDDLEQTIQQRFQQAVEAVMALGGGMQVAMPGTPPIMSDDAVGTLCVRLELLAEIETPEAHKAERMQYQLTQLADKMRGEVRSPEQEFQAILQTWYATPCVTDEARGAELARRFTRARDHYLRRAD